MTPIHCRDCGGLVVMEHSEPLPGPTFAAFLELHICEPIRQASKITLKRHKRRHRLVACLPVTPMRLSHARSH
jgi:hypothetical protein